MYLACSPVVFMAPGLNNQKQIFWFSEEDVIHLSERNVFFLSTKTNSDEK